MNRYEIEDLVGTAEAEIEPALKRIKKTTLDNQRKVLEAFWSERVSQADFNGTTGYGLDDEGRDKLERIYALVFRAPAALVRQQIVSGTHAIRLGLFGTLRPGNHIVFASGGPYDTLESVVGIRPTPGSLAEWGITYTIVPLTESGSLDVKAIKNAVKPETTVVMFQRSRGYSQRPALTIDELEQAFNNLSAYRPNLLFFVDNCYGEFVETREPVEVGAHLVMGSLIKNPGGGLASTGGYVIGEADLVEKAAAQLTAPGVGAEIGPSQHLLREFYQGLYMAPHTVGEALSGSVLAANVLARCGFKCSPVWDEPRSDLILSVEFDSADNLLLFCRAVQSAAAVDSFVVPQPAPMAGYDDEVVMAAGTFVQGGSLELSADAPLRAPYFGYIQGGLTYEHVRIAVENILSEIFSRNGPENPF
ncbi:methionine gamma-lyase family protein [Alicyclobacillus sp. SO9]|uniref:methionine gamma-lyase family protein n=1 Tax=Alicyclobacillus sp. SO9 TaxID=2665646 RepID=UPI0018E747E6|nr:methionine gamma-lyase family protein [Alicyclobacillus sp. SO9]QQE80978.1 methionine gamma-lyase family protein [Alicyclobacillus sp. SO9]